jgi:predicted alpha/beta hydrolase family esterase
MSRFARIVEDPEYEEPVVSDWAEVLDGFVTVAEKPHEEYSPFETVNS